MITFLMAISATVRSPARRFRAPITNAGVPQGILSTDDIITHSDLNKWQGCCELSAEEIIRALKRLYGRKFPVVLREVCGRLTIRHALFFAPVSIVSNREP